MDKSKQIAVLVVEDLALIRMNAAAVIRDAGFKVYEARDADEAIRMLQEHLDIRILFTDLVMPGSLDGLKLAHYVRDRWPPVKIIIASGHPKLGVLDMPWRGAFLTKPYRPEEITGKLREMEAQLQAA
jgi:two-component system, response regulator PdtaR